MIDADQPPLEARTDSGYVDLWYHPKVWHGMLFSAWLRLFFRNRGRFSLARLPAVVTCFFFTAGHSVLRVVQQLIFGRRIAATRIEKPPVFIIGHWRSGTTRLHELLDLDARHTCPNTYECFTPHHFLLTQWIVRKFFGWAMPQRRPMDNMQVGWDRPQEDEFALCALGRPSPYWTLAFPNHAPQAHEYLDFDGVDREAISRWKRSLLWFFQLLTYRDGNRLILKSPPHTGRVRVLLELFPEARFIHIVREPARLYVSTVSMWRKMYVSQGLQQPPRYEGLEDYVLRTLEQMYTAFEESREAISPGRLFEVRYEELVDQPLETLSAMYEQLELDDFDDGMRCQLEQHLAAEPPYETNEYEIDPAVRQTVLSRWGRFFDRYGYEVQQAEEA